MSEFSKKTFFGGITTISKACTAYQTCYYSQFEFVRSHGRRSNIVSKTSKWWNVIFVNLLF